MQPNTSLAEIKSPAAPSRIPLWLKVSFTAFMAVLIPVYWTNYGPSNFLYFCDIALFITLYAVWKESSHAASMAAVGILLPQVFWCLDFGVQLFRMISGGAHTGMTAYMFDGTRPLFLRGLSLFHGWLPFLLVFLVSRLGSLWISARRWCHDHSRRIIALRPCASNPSRSESTLTSGADFRMAAASSWTTLVRR